MVCGAGSQNRKLYKATRHAVSQPASQSVRQAVGQQPQLRKACHSECAVEFFEFSEGVAVGTLKAARHNPRPNIHSLTHSLQPTRAANQPHATHPEKEKEKSNSEATHNERRTDAAAHAQMDGQRRCTETHTHTNTHTHTHTQTETKSQERESLRGGGSESEGVSQERVSRESPSERV